MELGDQLNVLLMRDRVARIEAECGHQLGTHARLDPLVPRLPGVRGHALVVGAHVVDDVVVDGHVVGGELVDQLPPALAANTHLIAVHRHRLEVHRVVRGSLLEELPCEGARKPWR